jgi:predicted GNAT family acetyltransferase
MAPTSTLSFDIDALTRTDIAAAFDLSAEAGENQSLGDWTMLLRHGETFSVRDSSGKPLAACATLNYPPRIGWIAVLLVSPPYRRRGIGTRLLRHVVERLRRQGLTPMLDVPAGAFEPEAFGFATLATIERWRGRGRGPGAAVSPADEQLRDAIQRDAKVFGGKREALLLDLAARPDALTVTAGDAHLFCRTGRRSTQVGPVLADTAAAGTSIVGDAIDTIDGEIILDVPSTQTELREMLAGRGFAVVETFARMALGRAPAPAERLRVTAGTDLG